MYLQNWRLLFHLSWLHVSVLMKARAFQPLVTAVRVFSPLGQTVGLPCKYGFESLRDLKQLSLQWKGPSNELLCHFIKHKAYQNCTPGYSLEYTPDNITLTIWMVKRTDFGTHVCSVSKRHEFSDFSIDLILKTGESG